MWRRPILLGRDRSRALETVNAFFTYRESELTVGLRIAVISDIHSNLDALRTVVATLPAYDQLLCLGDIVGYGAEPNGVIEELQHLNPEVVLMGNHDYAVATGDTAGFSPHAALAVEWTRGKIERERLRYLSQLRPSMKLESDTVTLGLFHGSPEDPLTEYIFPGIPYNEARQIIHKGGARLVLLGHTHIPMIYSFVDEMLANPGSVGQPRDGDPRASFGILTILDGKFSFEVKRVTYDVDSAASKIIEARLPSFLADRLYTGM